MLDGEQIAPWSVVEIDRELEDCRLQLTKISRRSRDLIFDRCDLLLDRRLLLMNTREKAGDQA